MATPVIMPRQGQSVESCIIAKWHKKKGDMVQAGDILFTYETDKATFDEEARIEGILLDIFFDEGDDVPVLTNVCVIGKEGESTEGFNPGGGNASAVQDYAADKKEDMQTDASENILADSLTMADGEKIKISPRARNLASRTGVDMRHANPTGPNGRIIERDIITLRESGPLATFAAREHFVKMDALSAQAATGIGGRFTTNDLAGAVTASEEPYVSKSGSEQQYEEVKLTNIRKVIAKAMHSSLSNTAQLTLNASFDATEILAYRKRLKEGKDRLALENITLNDIIIYAVSRTLLSHKAINAHYLDDRMLLFNIVHLGVAVDTERGLMVPTLFNANLKSLNEISCETKALIHECHKGTINPDKLKGATFTITNLGALDIESFTPVLNPPQVGILGVSSIIQRVKEVNGEYVHYPAMGLSLTFDHRALDGAPAARFLKELKANLENFSLLLAK